MFKMFNRMIDLIAFWIGIYLIFSNYLGE